MTCSGISIPWFDSRPSINNAIEKPKNVPQKLILEWTEHCLTEFQSHPSLAEFQQWLELQAHAYDKVNRENPMRDTFPNSKMFENSNCNANTAYRNNTTQPLISLVVNQERNQKHQLQQNLRPQSTISSPKSFNSTNLAKNAKAITASQLDLKTRYSIVSKNSLCTNSLSI